MKNKILFISCARSDFGLLFNLYQEFLKNKKFIYNFLCTGTVVSKDYGYTKKEINSFSKNITLIFNKKTSTKDSDILKNIYENNLKLLRYLKSYKPNLVFILGDRIEAIQIAIIVRFLNIPIAHLHGGESTIGVYDDYWRHAISKISNLHFVSNLKYKNNLIKMGEDKNNIFVVGAFGLETINKYRNKLHDEKYFEENYKFKFNRNNFLIIFHSMTHTQSKNLTIFKNILSAAKSFNNSNLFISYPGFDLGSQKIIEFFFIFKDKKAKNIFFFNNLGNKKFLSLANLCDLTIGNSSSGIIEIPYLNKPVINIGSRQKGRLKANIVFDSKSDLNSIKISIKKCLGLIKNNKLPLNDKVYGNFDASFKTVKIIDRLNFSNFNKKTFF